MVRNVLIPAAAGLLVLVVLVLGYRFVLGRMVMPYRMSLQEQIENIEKNSEMRQQEAQALSAGEKAAFLAANQGEEPTIRDLNLETVALSVWRDYCIYIFAVFGLGTLISFVVKYSNAKKGHIARHLAALPAFAFALPILYLPEGALRLLKPISLTFSLVYIGTLLLTRLVLNRKPDQVGG